MNRYAQMDRNKRINRRAELRSSDIAPAKEQYIYCLKTTVYAFPDWLYPKAVKGLETNFDQIWLTSWQLVDWVMDRDPENGGKPEVHRFKYRRCQVCGLARLNLLADERRRLDESAIDGRELPCNPECNSATQAAKRGSLTTERVGQSLAPNFESEQNWAVMLDQQANPQVSIPPTEDARLPILEAEIDGSGVRTGREWCASWRGKADSSRSSRKKPSRAWRF